MLPKKIYLRKEELQEQFMCERMVSCDVPIGSCNVEYTDLSQVWHDATEKPNKDMVLLLKDKYGYHIMTLDHNCNWVTYAEGLGVQKWAYIDDLLPKGCEK